MSALISPYGRAAAVVFIYAAPHWLDDYAALFPQLLGMTASSVVLAAPYAGRWDESSHRLLRETAARFWPDQLN